MTDADSIKSILILDDDMDFRLLLKTILRKYFQNAVFHEYDPVALGAPADDYDWCPYDVLILDYYLCVHRLTGLDLLQKHRKRPGFPAAIMLTGAGTEETAVRAVKFGAYEYLRKDKLDKAVLAASILSAYQKHAAELVKQGEANRARSIFDKSLFYRQLEQNAPSDPAVPARVFLLFDIDNYQTLITYFGSIACDNLGRDLARLIFDHPLIKQGNPCITRLGESAVGVLIDKPAGKSALNAVLDDLCRHIAATPYQQAGNTLVYTISIGAVELDGTSSVESLFRQAGQARDAARSISGNSFYVHPGEGDQKTADTAAETVPAITARTMDAPHDRDGQNEVVHELSTPAMPSGTEEVPEQVAGVTELSRAPVQFKDADLAAGTVTAVTVPPELSAETVVVEKTQEHKQPDEEPEIREAELDAASLAIKKAFDDNRSVQTFQPVIAMFSSGEGVQHSLLRTDIQLVGLDGKVTTAGELRARLGSLPLQKFIDRWMLRQLLGRIVHTVRDEDKKRYLLPITEAWFTDIALFDWLKKLLAGQEEARPGRFIVLEISSELFARYQERVMILIKTLRKTYGFKIALGNFNDLNEAVKMAKILKPDFFVLDYNLLTQLKDAAAGTVKDMNFLNTLKSAGMQIIISGVENATILTEVISAGADYVYGNFIGEPQSNADESSNIESFSLG